jgi:hypothetical protein
MGAPGKQCAQVAGLLGGPLPHWVSGDAREVDLPGSRLGPVAAKDCPQARRRELDAHRGQLPGPESQPNRP